MKPGSVIIDVSIDQGGCVETSRPTTLDDPTFMLHGVVHYCVGNMTASIPRTASRALASASLSYFEEIAGKGLDGALREDPGLAAGVYLYRGEMVNERVGAALNLPAKPLSQLLEGRAMIMNWLDDYKSKLRSADEAVKLIQSGDSVYYGGNAAIPWELVRALARRKDELRDVRLSHVLLIGEDPLSTPEMAAHFRHNSLFVGPADREAVNDGRADYMPVFLYLIPRLFLERIVPLDVTMVQVSPPDDARLHEPGRRDPGLEGGLPDGEDRHRPGQREDAAHPGRLLHPRQPRPRHRGAQRGAPDPAGASRRRTWRRRSPATS